MGELLLALGEQAVAQSIPEIIAVLTAVGYLVLAIRQNIWCWLCAGISTSIYVYLLFAARLYMESCLNVFYFAMAVYGWIVWTRGKGGEELPVTVWPLMHHVRAILGIVGASAVSGYLLESRTDAVYPYIDSLITWGAIWATFLVARKVLENWWYWLIIDVASVFIYWFRDLQFTAALFVLYVIMIPFGLLAWKRSMDAQST